MELYTESCPTRKLSDKTQPNDTRNCRTVSLSNNILRPLYTPTTVSIQTRQPNTHTCTGGCLCPTRMFNGIKWMQNAKRFFYLNEFTDGSSDWFAVYHPAPSPVIHISAIFSILHAQSHCRMSSRLTHFMKHPSGTDWYFFLVNYFPMKTISLFHYPSPFIDSLCLRTAVGKVMRL